MTPSILIAGATGNTGRAVVQTLPKLLQSSSTLTGYCIITLTRNSSSPVARELAKLPRVEVIKQNWVEITANWLHEHYLTFHLNALNAGVNSPQFNNLQWTSLQPNIFLIFVMSPTAEFIKKYRKTGEQNTLRLILSKDAPVGIINSNEVSVITAHLLSRDDTSAYNKSKYILNRPDDITGMQIVSMVEQHIGMPVKDVSYKDLSFIDMVYEDKYTETK
ncbi:putative NmrA-like family protein [Aspergillus lentulus]|uniref:NmrA-like family protein n=1 Tax=Aspergillus lentulus TaxID=293939 RepID=A0ABQ1B5D3_ASPLE|nr:putative NmrA-like family protein [Aspergillus lentulus]